VAAGMSSGGAVSDLFGFTVIVIVRSSPQSLSSHLNGGAIRHLAFTDRNDSFHRPRCA